MTIFFIIFIILNILTIFMIFWEISKRKKLGNVLMKVKLDIKRYLLVFLWFLIGLLGIYLIIRGIIEFNYSSGYDKEFYRLLLTMSITYILAPILHSLRIIKAREIREKGIILSRGIVNFYDISGLNWLCENKIEIIFVGSIIRKQHKEKWTLKDNQITDLKKLLQEKYYDAFNISIVK